MNDKIEPYHSDNKQTLGELFFGFLEYYCNFKWVFSGIFESIEEEIFQIKIDCHSYSFSFERYAISVRTAGLIPIEECRGQISYKNDPTEWKQLCIEGECFWIFFTSSPTKETLNGIYFLFTEPFDRSNTARSCCDEKIFERIKKIFHESWLLLRQTKDLDRLFSEPLVPPAYCSYYDNYTPVLYQPMDYILR